MAEGNLCVGLPVLSKQLYLVSLNFADLADTASKASVNWHAVVV